MAVRITTCFAPGKSLSRSEAQYFGSEVAEPAIIRDYLTLTHGSVLGEKERDWWDEGPLEKRIKNHLAILDRRHRLSAVKRAALRSSPIPDILTYRGIDREKLKTAALFQSVSSLTRFPRIPVLIAEKGNRHEFYEIKPANLNGQSDGRDKVDGLRKYYSDAGLPYSAGTTYPDIFYNRGIAHIPLLMRSKTHLDQWRSAVKVAMVREGIGRIELYLEASRHSVKNGGRMPHGLLLYRICVAIEVEKDRSDAVAVRIARDLVHAWTICATATQPDEVRNAVRQAFLAFEPAAITRGNGLEVEPQVAPLLYTPRFPLIELTFVEILPLLRSTQSAMREALISRGIGLPGEEYLVCCDEAFFAQLASDAMPLLNLLTVISRTPLRWYGYAKDRGSLGVMDMVIEVNTFLSQAKAFGLDAFTDLVKWGNENPGKRTVVVLVILVVAAATIYFTAPLIAAELGFGAIAVESATEMAVPNAMRVVVTETVPQQVVQAAMERQIMEEALLAEEEALAKEAAKAVLQRQAAKQAVRATVRATAVPRGVAGANAARQALLSQAGTPLGRQAAAEFLKRAGPGIAAGGIGILIGASGRVAYAAEKNMKAGSEASGPAIGVQVGRMFLLRADGAPPPPPPWLADIATAQPIKPQIGQQFDAARFSKEAAATLTPNGPTQVTCRYLGRLKLS